MIVSAAGNEATNVDSIPEFPTARYLNKKSAGNVIKVGATSPDSSLVAYYSNYGKNILICMLKSYQTKNLMDPGLIAFFYTGKKIK